MNNNLELEILSTPAPVATSTYAPVSHREIVEAIGEELDKRSLNVVSKTFHPARDNKQLIGYFDVASPDNELGFRLAFRNSYDKTMSVGFVAGTNVWICRNGMISGEIQFLRKHTGSVATELHAKIITSIDAFDHTLNRMVKHKDSMKQIHVDKTAAAELCGKMFIEQDLITATQLSIIKGEIFNPSFDYQAPESLWELYNHTTHSLKKAHPLNFINQHVEFHNFIETEYSL